MKQISQERQPAEKFISKGLDNKRIIIYYKARR